MSDQAYLLILRLLHITCSVFWAGSVIYLALFLIPAAKASGPEGVKFMQQLGKTGYPIVIMIAAMITVLSGILLIWKSSGGFQSAWFSTSYARVLSMGGATSIIAFIIGFTVNRPVGIRMNKIGKAIDQTGGVPSPEQIHELMTLRKRLFTATKYIAILLTLTVIAMSIFRYV
jgi:uncharacterized membrane protein